MCRLLKEHPTSCSSSSSVQLSHPSLPLQSPGSCGGSHYLLASPYFCGRPLPASRRWTNLKLFFPSQSCHDASKRNFSSRVWLLHAQLRFWLVMAQIPSRPHPPLLNGWSSVGSSSEGSHSSCGSVLFCVFWLTAYKAWWRRSPTKIT